MRYIIVDGYNVIRSDPRLLSIEERGLEQARHVLAQTLASSPRLANDRISVVFDGRFARRTHVHSHRLGRVDMLYSARGQTADEVIVAQAGALAGRGRVVVVTNDVELRERCRALGCEVSGSENLLQQLPGRPRRRAAVEDEGGEPTLSTVKRGNPRRTSRRERRKQEIRF